MSAEPAGRPEAAPGDAALGRLERAVAELLGSLREAGVEEDWAPPVAPAAAYAAADADLRGARLAPAHHDRLWALRARVEELAALAGRQRDRLGARIGGTRRGRRALRAYTDS